MLVCAGPGNTTAKDGKSFVYDAWNRLVAVKNGATTIAYDALRRRIKKRCVRCVGHALQMGELSRMGRFSVGAGADDR